MAYLSLSVEKLDGYIAQVTLLGPGKGNSMGEDLWRELPEVFDALSADDEVRAIVLTGSGANFTVGLNLTEVGSTFGPLLGESKALARQRTELHSHILRLQKSVNAIAECRKPVIAAISGWCVGGGVDIAAAVDVRVASADAKFSIREVKVAIVADLGSLARLPYIISDGHLRELALTGRDFDAKHAEKIGLVNEVFATKAACIDGAQALAREIAQNPPLVVQGIKDVLDHDRARTIADSLRYVAAWNAAFLPSEDLVEAMAAFITKRAPEFTGE